MSNKLRNTIYEDSFNSISQSIQSLVALQNILRESFNKGKWDEDMVFDYDNRNGNFLYWNKEVMDNIKVVRNLEYQLKKDESKKDELPFCKYF